MKFERRFAFGATPEQRRELERLGIRPKIEKWTPEGHKPFISFDVEESHPSWPTLQPLLLSWDAGVGFLRTLFTEAEIADAKWLCPLVDLYRGYPQPRPDSFGYLQVTYDLAQYCENCGTGATQKAPFQMKGEPKWGRRSIMQLNWIYGEFFVTPDAWASVFEPAGIACRPVHNTKEAELETVVQLVVDEAVPIETDGLESERCAQCGRTKYLPVKRGPFPGLRDTPTASAVRTAEYFGSGAQADQWVLVSQALARAMTAAGIRGASFEPVMSPP